MPSKKLNIHKKIISNRNDMPVSKEDEFDIFAKSLATQLRQLPLNISLMCQNELHAIITKARMKAFKKSNDEAENISVNDADEFDNVGNFIGENLRKMKTTQQVLAENLVQKIITKGSLNELSEHMSIRNLGENACDDDDDDKMPTNIPNLISNVKETPENNTTAKQRRKRTIDSLNSTNTETMVTTRKRRKEKEVAEEMRPHSPVFVDTSTLQTMSNDPLNDFDNLDTAEQPKNLFDVEIKEEPIDIPVEET